MKNYCVSLYVAILLNATNLVGVKFNPKGVKVVILPSKQQQVAQTKQSLSDVNREIVDLEIKIRRLTGEISHLSKMSHLDDLLKVLPNKEKDFNSMVRAKEIEKQQAERALGLVKDRQRKERVQLDLLGGSDEKRVVTWRQPCPPAEDTSWSESNPFAVLAKDSAGPSTLLVQSNVMQAPGAGVCSKESVVQSPQDVKQDLSGATVDNTLRSSGFSEKSIDRVAPVAPSGSVDLNIQAQQLRDKHSSWVREASSGIDEIAASINRENEIANVGIKFKKPKKKQKAAIAKSSAEVASFAQEENVQEKVEQQLQAAQENASDSLENVQEKVFVRSEREVYEELVDSPEFQRCEQKIDYLRLFAELRYTGRKVFDGLNICFAKGLLGLLPEERARKLASYKDITLKAFNNYQAEQEEALQQLEESEQLRIAILEKAGQAISPEEKAAKRREVLDYVAAKRREISAFYETERAKLDAQWEVYEHELRSMIPVDGKEQDGADSCELGSKAGLNSGCRALSGITTKEKRKIAAQEQGAQQEVDHKREKPTKLENCILRIEYAKRNIETYYQKYKETRENKICIAEELANFSPEEVTKKIQRHKEIQLERLNTCQKKQETALEELRQYEQLRAKIADKGMLPEERAANQLKISNYIDDHKRKILNYYIEARAKFYEEREAYERELRAMIERIWEEQEKKMLWDAYKQQSAQGIGSNTEEEKHKIKQAQEQAEKEKRERLELEARAEAKRLALQQQQELELERQRQQEQAEKEERERLELEARAEAERIALQQQQELELERQRQQEQAEKEERERLELEARAEAERLALQQQQELELEKKRKQAQAEKEKRDAERKRKSQEAQELRRLKKEAEEEQRRQEEKKLEEFGAFCEANRSIVDTKTIVVNPETGEHGHLVNEHGKIMFIPTLEQRLKTADMNNKEKRKEPIVDTPAKASSSAGSSVNHSRKKKRNGNNKEDDAYLEEAVKKAQAAGATGQASGSVQPSNSSRKTIAEIQREREKKVEEMAAVYNNASVYYERIKKLGDSNNEIYSMVNDHLEKVEHALTWCQANPNAHRSVSELTRCLGGLQDDLAHYKVWYEARYGLNNGWVNLG